MTNLLNDVFDIMNGRFYKEAITDVNWPSKKKKLYEMLTVLDETEDIYNESNKRDTMFASTTTIRGWRTSIKSTIGIVEDLFAENYSFVLTGKFNQDALEVSILISLKKRSQM